MRRLCGQRNVRPMPSNRVLASGEWLLTDWLAMCRLPYGHSGDHHWRVPYSYSPAQPDYEECCRMTAVVDEVGHLGAAAVDAQLRNRGPRESEEA